MGVYPNSTYAGSFILGSLNAPGTGVVVQEWYHKTAEGGYWIQLFTEHGCIPVQTLMFGKNSAGNEVHYHHDYMDVTLGVKDRAIFDVPKECL
uniref:Mammalian ependymin-related protein 1 n=1 Tax=Ciona intestinalis TaxID=7719 RepID=H2XKX3_CIOIN